MRITLAIVVLCAARAAAAGPLYGIVDGAIGGAGGAPSLGVGVGLRLPHGHVIEGEGFALLSDDVGGNAIDAPAPGRPGVDYVLLGERHGNEWGGVLRYGHEVASGLTVLVGAGATWRPRLVVAASTQTLRLYTQSRSTVAFADVCGGIQYRLGTIGVVAGLDLRRGFVGGLAVDW